MFEVEADTGPDTGQRNGRAAQADLRRAQENLRQGRRAVSRAA